LIVIGSTVGAYRVLAFLGSGGMGEVYRASDERLRREVALKVLPPWTASDPHAIERLKREARALAVVSHQNIATVFGLEEVDGQLLVVMELVPGDTLADRIRPGGLRMTELLHIARQIVDGVEGAHAMGVIHRDLKPANIKVTPDNRVKILDFGLMRVSSGTPFGATERPESTVLTETGSIVGTPGYMSPEQARGQVCDTRADIWGVGCVIYEMVTGSRPFEGSTRSDVLVAVLDREPRWERLPAGTPPALRRLLRRCLEKDLRRRLHHVADARLEIDLAREELSAAQVPVKRRRTWVAAGLAAVLTFGATAGWLASRTSAGSSDPSPRFVIDLPDGVPLEATRQAGFALSPDGWQLVYPGDRGGQPVLLLHSLGTSGTTPLAGTDGAEGPFFAPSGEWVGFSVGGKLKKVSIASGLVVTICDAPDPRGAVWGEDDVITFAPGPFTGLFRVSADGGIPREVTRLADNESTHRWPHASPGGREIVYTIGSKSAPSFDEADLAQLSVSSGKTRRLLKGTFGTYSPTGHLLFVRNGSLMAARIDPASGVAGSPSTTIEGVGARPFSGTGWYATSKSGTLVYASALGSSDNLLVWVDRSGRTEPVTTRTAAYSSPRLSPDGTRIAVTVYAPDGTPDVWVHELKRGSLSRLTLSGLNTSGVWSPDGKFMAFTSRREGDRVYQPWIMATDGGSVRPLGIGEVPGWPTSWSARDGWLAFTHVSPSTSRDVMAVAVAGGHETRAVVETSYEEMSGAFSPDGRWIAFMSNESGRFEIYVQAFPSTRRKWQVSVDGGGEPVWSRDGRELYFREGKRVMAAPIAPGSGGDLQIGSSVPLFEGDFEFNHTGGLANFDVGPLPRDFLMVQATGGSAAPRLTVALNWFGEVARRVP
jgi:Tol biopolymer transport system component